MMSEQRVRTITCREVHELSRKQPINLIDVRTAEEFQEVRAVGARCIPMASQELFGMLQSGGAGDQPIYFICAVGGRSGRVCEAFMAAGQMNVFNIEGGTQAWVEAGLPVESGA
jgi:rhodanese-related sulfurtransferase